MKLLWVVTKTPWPPTDGGRLVVQTTLEALCARGHEIDLVAPCAPAEAAEAARRLTHLCRPHLVPLRRRPVLLAALASAWSGTPLTIARHDRAAVRAAVAACLRERTFDVVHAEQLQALAPCAAAFARGVPVTLRCQNVESDLWHGAPERAAFAAIARREAARLAAFEGRALRRAAAVVALTAADRARLAALGGGALAVEHVPAPFPAELPPGAALAAGDPAVAVLGSGGWWPNRDGIAWLLGEVWPRVRAQLPTAALHVFGDLASASPAAGVFAHPPPIDSRTAFPEGAVCAVPLRHGSGVRMRILEAWARGVPVVATPQAVQGLDVAHGCELLVAERAEDFVVALQRLAHEPRLRHELIAAGRARLRARHDPATIATRLEQVYLEARRRRDGDRAPHPVVGGT